MKHRNSIVLVLALALLIPIVPRAAAQTTVPCEQDYIVVPGDWLSNIGYKFFGSVYAYQAIFLATNQKAQTDSSYATLSSPASVEVGAKLCIPSRADAETLMSAPLETTTAPTFPTVSPTVTATNAAPTPTTAAANPTTAPTNPTTAPVSAIATGLRPEDITFNAYGLGEVQGRVVPAMPYDNSSPPAPVGAPAHIAFQLAGEDRLWVIPAAAYQAQWDAAGNSTVSRAITQLHLLLRDKPDTQKPPMPFLPALPATNDLVARIRYLDFDGGSGVAYIGRIAQDPSPILAGQLYYTFLGLTNDGKYIVSFRYPVLTSALPKTTDNLTSEHLAEIAADPQTYFQQTTDILNKLGNSSFGPDLSRMDALVFSLHVPSVGAPIAPPVGGSLPTPGASNNSGGASSAAPTSVAGSTPVASAAAGAAANKQRLLATDWKWVSTTSATATLTVDIPDKYSLRFNNANGFGITADCNFGAGNFTVSGNVLNIIDLQASKAYCDDSTLDTQFASQLLQAATFSFQGNFLLIQLQGDAGTMKFSR